MAVDQEQGFRPPVPKFEDRKKYLPGLPPPPDASIGPNKPVDLSHQIVGKTGAETLANLNAYTTNKYDYNNYGKLTAFDAGPNGANLARYKGYGEETFRKIGFDPSIDNETKFNQGTTWWDDTKRMLSNSFMPLYGEGLMANLKSYVDVGRGDFGQDIRAAANYEKYSNVGYSSKSGVMPFISNTVMSYAYTAGILTEAVAEAFLLRKISPAVFGGKDFLLSAPKDLSKVVKSGADYLGDMRNISNARSFFNTALTKTGNFINPINHTWDNFATNIYRNEENITNLARAQRTFGAFYKDLRNLNMALSEGKLEGGFVENKMMNELYNDHYFRTGETPDDKTMELYQRKAEAAGFSATMQNTALVFYTNKITLPTLMKMGPFKALDNIGRELTEGTLLKTGKGLAARTGYQKKNLINALKSVYNPKSWGRGGLNYFKANLMEGIQENLQDVIADSTQSYYTNSIFQPERGKFEMYMAGLKEGLNKQWSAQGLETFASGFLMGFGNTVVESVVSNTLKGGKYLKDGKAYTNYLNERHDGGQQISDIVNEGLKTPEKFFGSQIFDHGNQALMQKEINEEGNSEKEKQDTKTTSFLSSVLTALDTGTFDMYVDNLEAIKQMNEVEVEDALKLQAGEGKKALERIDKIIDKAKTIQAKHEYHESRFRTNVNPNDYKEGTIEREQAELVVEANRKAKFNAIFLDASYEDNVDRIAKMGDSIASIFKYAKPKSNLMMSDFNALYDRDALKTEIKLLDAQIASAEGITDPIIVAQREESAKKLERLKKFDKAQTDYDQVEQSKIDGSLAVTEYLKKQVLESEGVTEEDKQKVKDNDEVILQKIQEIEGRYKMALKDYLSDIVGGESNYEQAMRKAEAEGKMSIDDLFTRLKDIKKLDVENQAILRYVNVLKDPGGYYEHVQKNYKWMKALYATKKEHIRQMIEKSLQTKEYQDLLKSLSDDGVYIDLDEFAKWVKNKSYQPKEFIDGTKEIVIPRDSDRYLKYYSQFVKVAKAQEERIASEKINKDQSLKDRTEELDRMKQKELDDVRTAYLKEIKEETGKSESELTKARAEFEEQNKGNLEELQKTQEELIAFLNLMRAVNSPVLLASFDQVRDKLLENGTLDKEVYNQLMLDAENIPEQLTKVTALYLENKKRLKNLSDDSVLLYSMSYHVLSQMLDTKFAEIQDQLTLAESATENPNLDFTTTKAYKVYQQRIAEIEAKYKKALEESKEDIDNFDDDAPRKAQINVSTPWEQLPKDLVDILQPKFEAWSVGKDFAEEDLYEVRQNWLLTQNAVIQTYLGASVGTTERPLETSNKIPKLKTLPKEQQEKLDASDVKNLSLTVGIRRTLQNRLDKKQDPPLTKEAKAAIQADIDALQKYINYQRSVATPEARLESIASDFLETLNELQKQVAENVVNGRRQNYILDQGKETETIPQRVTELTEDIAMEMDPTKPPFLAAGLNDKTLLLAIDQLMIDINEGTIRKDSAIEAFILTMNTLIGMGKLRQFASEDKMNDVRGLLYMDAVKRGVMTKQEAIAGLTAAKLGKSQYAKDIEAYEAPEAIPTPVYNTGTERADIEKKIEYFNNTIEPEFEEGDYFKVLALAEKQIKDGTISQTPENVQLISNYPKLFEEFIKATDARNKTIKAFDKEKVLVGQPNELPIYAIESTINEATKRLEIKWVEVRKEAITNIQLTKIENYAASELISYKNKLEQELAALGTTDETDLEDIGEPLAVLSLSGVLNILSDVAHQESSDVGTVIDDMIRDYLLFKEPVLPAYMTKNHPAYIALFGPKGIITELRDKVLEGKYTILSDHIKVFDRNLGLKDANGKPMGLAGEIDLMYIDNTTGEIEIVDIKTAKKANWTYWDIDKKIKSLEIQLAAENKKLETEKNPKKLSVIKKDIASLEADLVKANAKWSNKLKYSIQQTIYRNLIYRMTGKMPNAIKLLPLEVDYTLDGVINNVRLATSVVDVDQKGNKGMFITLDPVAEVNKYVPIGTVKETIETPEDVEFEETEVISNQVSNNLGKSFVYNGRIGTLILTPEGTYALDTPTEVIDIILNGKNKISPDATLESLSLTPVKITERPFMTISIDGKEYKISQFDTEDDSIIINGVKYKALRTAKTKKVNGVEFMSNQNAIEEIDAKIREVSSDLVKRKQEGSREGENVNQFLERTAERQIELETLTAERATLAANNKIRTIKGTNAQDIIFIINQSPETFVADVSKSVEEEQEDLNEIKSLFPSDAAFNEVFELMKTRPASLDMLIKGESDQVKQSDIEEIKKWTDNAIAQLMLSANSNEDALAMLQKLKNELELITYTKNGKINKRSIKKSFRGETQEGGRGANVSNVQKPTPGSAEGVSGQPGTQKGGVSPQKGKEIIDKVKGKAAGTTEDVKDLFGDLGTDEEVEGYDEIRNKIMKATEAELEDIMNDLLKKAIRNEISLNEAALDQLYQERLFQLQENVTVQDVKKNQSVVSVSPIINKETSEEIPEGTIFKVTKVNEKSVVLQSLENKNDKIEMTAANFAKKFKPYMKKGKTKTTVQKPITQEYKDVSIDVAEELDNFAQDQSNIQAIQETFGEMTDDEADDAFMDAVKQCKTK